MARQPAHDQRLPGHAHRHLLRRDRSRGVHRRANAPGRPPSRHRPAPQQRPDLAVSGRPFPNLEPGRRLSVSPLPAGERVGERGTERIDSPLFVLLRVPMAVALSTRERLDRLFKQRIVIFDGSMGVMLQHKGLSDEEFRGERFRNHPKPLRNNSDVLCLTQPALVTQVHCDYLEAGADLITTNTFTATRVSQADYGLADVTYEMNLEGARLARKAADAFENRFVAGSLGPTNVTLSLSPKVDDPSYREITFDELRDGYAEAARALREGGVDFFLIETIFDTLNGKAAIAAVKDVAPELPLFVSVTIVDRSGRNLSGQTVEAFWTSVEHAEPFAVGVNCSLGATEMRPYIAALSRVAPVYVTCYPNAGLPNAFGGYDEEPPITSRLLKEFAESGYLNAAGGCCGTTAEHIRQIRTAVATLRLL